MKIEQVAAQLYTIRQHTQNAADFVESMLRIREIGYRAVQVSAIGPIPDDEVMLILDGEGLTCCAAHINGQKIVEETDGVIEKLKKWRCPHVAYPHPGETPLETVADVKRFAAQLESAGKKLHDAGITLSYHNHSLEFRRIRNRTILDWIYRTADPTYLKAEIDTYWVQHGGGDPVETCRKLKGRLPLIHMKDYKITADNKPDYAEIGNGNLNWKRIIAAAEKSGCEWFIVEQDTCPGDPFDSLKMSFDYVASKFIKTKSSGGD